VGSEYLPLEVSSSRSFAMVLQRAFQLTDSKNLKPDQQLTYLLVRLLIRSLAVILQMEPVVTCSAAFLAAEPAIAIAGRADKAIFRENCQVWNG